MTSDNAPIPNLSRLHERHYGLTPSVCECYSEGARVCFSRHYQPPIDIEVHMNDALNRRSFEWETPDKRTQAAWNNESDATRDGAYSVSLATIEIETGLVAISRAETRTGADYYIGSPNSIDDLEDAYRLEVSGTDGNRYEVNRRLKEKIQQTKDGESDLPAIASVVGFQERCVFIKTVED